MVSAARATLSHRGGMEDSGVKPAGYTIDLFVDHFLQVPKSSECYFPS